MRHIRPHAHGGIVAQAFKSDKASDLDIQAKALYLLSVPSTPQEARDEALERAEEGEEITHAVARRNAKQNVVLT